MATLSRDQPQYALRDKGAGEHIYCLIVQFGLREMRGQSILSPARILITHTYLLQVMDPKIFAVQQKEAQGAMLHCSHVSVCRDSGHGLTCGT